MNCPHCQIEIDEHEANRCLDAWVAEAVMGWKPYFIISYNVLYPPSRQVSADEHPIIYAPFEPDRPYDFDSNHFYNSSQTPPRTEPVVPSYSTSIAAAWDVLARFFRYDVGTDGMLFICEVGKSPTKKFIASADSAPLAICRAALKGKPIV